MVLLTADAAGFSHKEHSENYTTSSFWVLFWYAQSELQQALRRICTTCFSLASRSLETVSQNLPLTFLYASCAEIQITEL